MLQINSANIDSSGCEVSYFLNFFIHAKQAGIYKLSISNYAQTGIDGICLNLTEWQTDSLHTGTLNLTKFDTVNHIVSGNFNFIAELTSGLIGTSTTDTIKNGYFNNLRW